MPVFWQQISSSLMSSSDILTRVSCFLGSTVGLPVRGDIASPLLYHHKLIIHTVTQKSRHFWNFFENLENSIAKSKKKMLKFGERAERRGN
jgi:hypothetical protein